MDITFLLGNGFDMGLNLKSGYLDFYPYFVKRARPDNCLRRALEDDWHRKMENWSDLELALGKYTEKLTAEKMDQFVRDKRELDELLREYLVSEQKKVEFSDEQMHRIAMRALERIRHGNNEEETSVIQNILRPEAHELYRYQCISFNYTECADRMWKRTAGVCCKNTMCRKNNRNIFGEVLHIHGTLSDHEMIIGVNDESQILNTELAKKKHIKWALIKPFLNNEIGQNKIKKAYKMIDGSQIICLYGMSLGITDNIWWEYIGQWMKRRQSHLLLIYNYNPDYNQEHPLQRLMYAEEVRTRFLSRTKLNDKEKIRVENRIIVYNNDNIFEMQRGL